jgi:hypothetical protein
MVITSTPPEDEPYFAALGKFIASYAAAENQVHILARRLTRLNDTKARIVFSGMRLGDLSERIRGLLRATDVSTKRYNEIDACLRQLDLIATQRNNLVHRFLQHKDGEIVVTNIILSKNIEVYEEHSFKLSDFEHMDDDCTAITIRLALAGGQRLQGITPVMREWMRRPWRYTRAQPTPPKKSPPKAPKVPQRPPDTSRG